MGKYPVTQEQYQAVIGGAPSHFKGAKNPVEQVSWQDAMHFCASAEIKWARGEDEFQVLLPTEAQWEYACRAGTTTEYHTGDGEAALMRAGWYDGNSGDKTQQVGQRKPNAWGLYDMHGNVWEWCMDWRGEYSKTSETDPTGPASGDGRVLRGGSWNYDAAFCRSAYRNWNDPTARSVSLGFRVVVSSRALP
jgi:formylglycine-generating enzyme required for sulfatase activity